MNVSTLKEREGLEIISFEGRLKYPKKQGYVMESMFYLEGQEHSDRQLIFGVDFDPIVFSENSNLLKCWEKEKTKLKIEAHQFGITGTGKPKFEVFSVEGLEQLKEDITIYPAEAQDNDLPF